MRSGKDDVAQGRKTRERAFWDARVPSVADCLWEYNGGPDVMTAALLDAVEPLDGARVLDFACGTGVTSAWLADRGATVTGLDLSPESTARAGEFCRATGAEVTFVTARSSRNTAWGPSTGSWAASPCTTSTAPQPVRSSLRTWAPAESGRSRDDG